MISEKKFNEDFAPIVGFYNYHIRNKKINIKLSDLQQFGVQLKPEKISNIEDITEEEIPLNTILFSSSKKNNNVKNLMWAIRCVAHHPENVCIIRKKNHNYYRLRCLRKDNKNKNSRKTMQGLVSCELWNEFIEKIKNRIKEYEKI